MNLACPLIILGCIHPSQTGDVVIPLTNRPANFSGAAGAYRMETHAAPTLVRVEDPITLTVKIMALQAKPSHAPQRDNLRLFPAELEANFFIEPVPEEDRNIAGENAWEFVWRLMPKREGVIRIPPLEFVYYYTAGPAGFKEADGGRSIALEVIPRPGLVLSAPPGTRAKFQFIVAGDSVLSKSASLATRPIALAAGLTLPPLLGFAAYFGWRLLFPEAAERLRRRRGRALRTALKQLRRVRRPRTVQVRAIVADYLCLRADLPAGEPTPMEVKKALELHELDAKLINKAEEFFRECDTMLFAPIPQTEVNSLQCTAKQLVESVEAAVCAKSSR